MIQFNLLPNVKLEYVKARRNKRLALLIATLSMAIAFGIFILLFVGVNVVQKKYSSDLSKDIKSESSKLQGTQDLNKILTIQNQLNSLTTLHNQKPVTTRFFGYLTQLTPTKASMASVNFSFTDQTISITGSADSLSTINKFVDTLKFTTYTTKSDKKGNAFSEVVLAGFGKDDKGASYQISAKFDPLIFDNTEEVSLVVPPNKITTRSETEKPEDLFQPLSNTQERQ